MDHYYNWYQHIVDGSTPIHNEYKQIMAYLLKRSAPGVLPTDAFRQALSEARRIHKQILNDVQPQMVLPRKEERVLLACSGGVDSMVLFHYLLLEGYEFGVCTMNHGLREEAVEEVALVQWYCHQWSIPCYVYTLDVLGAAESHQESLETAGRRLRYERLYALMEEHGYTRIATAHHGDDQLETILMHLLRGAHVKGLLGMQCVEGNLWRPFLGTSKQRIRAYAEGFQLWHGEDRSNEELFCTRNQIRHEVIPVLERLQPNLKERMQALVTGLEDDEAALQAWTYEVVASLEIHKDSLENGIVIPKIRLSILPVAVLRRLWIAVVYDLYPEVTLQRTHVDQLVKLSQGEGGKEFSLGRMKVLSNYDTIEIGLLSSYEQHAQRKQRIKDVQEMTPEAAVELEPQEFLIPRSLVQGQLSVRHRRAGDVMMLVDAMGRVRGHTSIKDWCREERIPAGIRDELWFLGDEGHHIFGLIREDQPIVMYAEDAVYYRGSFEEDKDA